MTTSINTTLAAAALASPAISSATPAAGFADLLATSTAKTPQGTITSGRVGMTLTPAGTPSTIVYYAADGSELTRSPMVPSRMLQLMDQFGIAKSDLTGLATQLDAAGVKYKPGELVSGVAGAGVNLDDLAAGGFGTTFDWTKDANVALKGPQAALDLATSQALATRLGVHGLSTVGQDLAADAGAVTLTPTVAAGTSSSTSTPNGSVAGTTLTAVAVSPTSPEIPASPAVQPPSSLAAQLEQLSAITAQIAQPSPTPATLTTTPAVAPAPMVDSTAAITAKTSDGTPDPVTSPDPATEPATEPAASAGDWQDGGLSAIGYSLNSLLFAQLSKDVQLFAVG